MVAKSMLTVPTGYIGTNKNRLKIYDDKVVFLENKQEFQFEIHNPTKDVIGVNILINGVLSSSSQLVLKPGESTWLDRYLDNPKKYVFETYEVDDTPANNAAIEDNGKIQFEFYREKSKKNLLYGNSTITYTNYNTQGWDRYPTPTYTGDILSNETVYFKSDCCSNSIDIGGTNSTPLRSTKETGRIGEGDNSNQKFSTVFYDFEYAPFHTIEYQILPLSQKNAVTADEVRTYCTNCGVRIKRQNWKFCPTCGNKL